MPKTTFFNLPQTKQSRILDATMRVVNAKGYDRTTVSDIVEASQIARGSFYQYFDDTFDVFMHLLASVQAEKMDLMQPVLERLEEEPFIELYPELVDVGLRFARQNEDAYLLGYQLHEASDETVRKLLKKMEKTGVALYADFIRCDQEKGFIKSDVNPVFVAKLFYHFTVRELFDLIYSGGTDADIKHAALEILSVIKYGIKEG